MSYRFKFLFALLFVGFTGVVSAQETFEMIHSLLQTRCAGGGCHGGGSNPVPSFDVTQSASGLYAALVNADPITSAAADKGDKLIKPGYPAQSFLLRKVAYGLSDVLALHQNEGGDMPQGGTHR